MRTLDHRTYVVSNTAYVASGRTGLVLADVTNPMQPVLKEIVNTPGEASHVVVRGACAYVADGSWGLTSIQLVDSPRLSARLLSSKNIQLEFPTVIGSKYKMLRATNLRNPVWDVLGNWSGTGSSVVMTQVVTANFSEFFRVQLEWTAKASKRFATVSHVGSF